ncbi:MAG: sugar transferase [Candidatus Diapherotrites archaeon]
MVKLFKDTFFFHTSVRVGKGGKPIIVKKIRTMKRGAHKEFTENHRGSNRFNSHDGRVTLFGKLLRKIHADELPQIISLLKGDLIPVGMRPVHRQEYKGCPAEIKEIYKEMGPGLGGIFYACHPFPPTDEQFYEEYRKFYKMWKKSKNKAYIIYGKRILKNRLTGKSWTK